MQGKITKRTVDALVSDGNSEIVLWDSTLRGFGIRLRSGGVKTYIIQYRMAGGRNAPVEKFTIGKHGSPWTPETAREEADRLLTLVKGGINPKKVRSADRESLTITQLCDLYLEEGCATKKLSTVYVDKGRIARHIKPLLGKKKAKDITRTDIQRFMQDIAAGKTKCDEKTITHGRAIVTGGKGTATRTVGLLGGIFSFAVERGICSINPVEGVERYKDKKNERFLSPVEFKRLGIALSESEKAWQDYDLALDHWQKGNRKKLKPKMPPEAENPIAISAIRLLILTGARKSEILTLEWAWVDFDTAYLRLPDSKTGAKVIPLGAAALEVLSSLPRLEKNPYVFPGGKEGTALIGVPKIWERIKKRAELDDVRIHDLRHSFASTGASSGDSLLLIGALLGHRDAKTTQRYAHLSDNPLKAAADRISNTIAANMKGDSAEVITITKRKNS